MEYLWLLTVIISLVIDKSSIIHTYKYAANYGYKIKFSSSIFRHISKYKEKMTLFELLFPIGNIVISLNNIEQYKKTVSMVLDSLSFAGLAKKMNKYEKREYNKKQTFINAFMISNELKNLPKVSDNETYSYRKEAPAQENIFEHFEKEKTSDVSQKYSKEKDELLKLREYALSMQNDQEEHDLSQKSK